jgi:hypothetical protein
MSAQYVLFADVIVGEKPISCFRTSPILTGKWNALTHASPELFEQQPKVFLEPLVSEIAGGIKEQAGGQGKAIFLVNMLFAFRQEDNRTRLMSRSGGAPNKRVYSRLNWDALSYPTRNAALLASRSSL